MNLGISVINISSYILSSFKRRDKINYDELLKQIKSNLDEDSEEIFPYALNLLFLLNKIKYESKTDSFILNEIK
ncbi:ABC-three component system middle component 6 [Hanstruepera marina]|uniref:ABC-three component system middle component 6 n=1 Tax=Hanstruepera marina TaxID=2873265 RepID=UPI0034E2D39D